jgi:hypothetical protein
MSQYITSAFVQQYSTNIMMLLQQQGSRFRGAVQEQAFVGKAASVVEQFGAVTPVKNIGRRQPTPLQDTPSDKRWVFPVDYDWADSVDNQDRLRMLIDPRGHYTQAGVNAMGRAIDDEIINGMFGTSMTGENGTTQVTLPASQIVDVAVGATGATGLNVAKLRAAKKLLMQAQVDVQNDPLFIAITAEQHDDLLNEVEVASLDYNSRPVLVDGYITRFMGFNFIHSERIPGGVEYQGTIETNGQYFLPCWAKSGVALGMWNDIIASVDKRPDLRNAYQVYVTGTFGGTRLEEKRFVQINCA